MARPEKPLTERARVSYAENKGKKAVFANIVTVLCEYGVGTTFGARLRFS